MPHMHASYVCLTCMPDRYALYVCLSHMPCLIRMPYECVLDTASASQIMEGKHLYACLYECLICMPCINAPYVCLICMHAPVSKIMEAKYSAAGDPSMLPYTVLGICDGLSILGVYACMCIYIIISMYIIISAYYNYKYYHKYLFVYFMQTFYVYRICIAYVHALHVSHTCMPYVSISVGLSLIFRRHQFSCAFVILRIMRSQVPGRDVECLATISSLQALAGSLRHDARGLVE